MQEPLLADEQSTCGGKAVDGIGDADRVIAPVTALGGKTAAEGVEPERTVLFADGISTEQIGFRYALDAEYLNATDVLEVTGYNPG